jgi:hypothetical protein
VRFHPDQRRDDYRSAAGIARLAAQEGKKVWWAAAHQSAEYYGVVFCRADHVEPAECVVGTDNREREELAGLPEPDVVFIGKPELFDRTGAVRSYIAEHGFQLTRRLMAFDMFEAP